MNIFYMFSLSFANVSYTFSQMRRADRDEIRRRLASTGLNGRVAGGAACDEQPTRRFHSRLRPRHTQHHRHYGHAPGGGGGGANLQVCFVNEASNDLDPVNFDLLRDGRGRSSSSGSSRSTLRSDEEEGEGERG